MVHDIHSDLNSISQTYETVPPLLLTIKAFARQCTKSGQDVAALPKASLPARQAGAPHPAQPLVANLSRLRSQPPQPLLCLHLRHPTRSPTPDSVYPLLVLHYSLVALHFLRSAQLPRSRQQPRGGRFHWYPLPVLGLRWRCLEVPAAATTTTTVIVGFGLVGDLSRVVPGRTSKDNLEA